MSKPSETKPDKNEQLSLLLQSKAMDWKAVRSLFLEEDGSTVASTVFAHGLCRQALSKACLDPTVCPRAMSLLLGQHKAVMITTDIVKMVLKSVRCHNTTACRAFLNAYNKLLLWSDARGNTILHLACAEYGWNPAISFWVDYAVPKQGLYGLFDCNRKDQCPLWLSLEAGADIADILNHLRERHPMHLSMYTEQLAKIMAEYCNEMTALQQLMEDDPTLLDGSSVVLPLHYACYYQNSNMIRFLLQHYKNRGDKRKKLLKRLTSTTSVNRGNDDDERIASKAPLASLVLGVGRSDSGNSIACVQTCLDILGNFPLLHYSMDEVLWPDGKVPPLTTKQCLQTVTRIVDRFQIDLLSLDDKKRSVTSLLIAKQPLAALHPERAQESIRVVLQFVLSRCPDAATARDRRKRLPLHLACEAGWQWNQTGSSQEVLAQLVRANPSALEEMDPKAKVFPCALATDLTTIYNLLRYQPGVVCR